MTEAASRAINFVLRWEGGYVNHPDDPGGETNFGISKRSYPELDIFNLSRDQAREIYHRDYWEAIHGDEMPEAIGLALMDFGVHSGPATAMRGLQAALGCERTGEFDEDTRTLLEHSVRKVGSRYLAELVVRERAQKLVRIGCTRKGSEAFLVGWMRRIVDNLRAVRRLKEA